MKSEIETAIKVLLEKIVADVKADDALKLTQSVLNLAHANGVIKQNE